jgi:hypothetical protein
MPIPQRRVSQQKRARGYSGEEEARDVVGWLNFRLFEDESTLAIWRRMEKVTGRRINRRREQERVIKILRLYEQSRIWWGDLRQHGFDSSPRSSPKKKNSPSLELDRRLRRYTFYPRFFPLGKLLSFAWSSTRPNHPDPSEGYDDVSAIADLAKLAEKDLLGHLKECVCGRWIWARFSHQRFCSARCRERHFRSSEKWKEHRRQKAREYYRLHKSGKVK